MTSRWLSMDTLNDEALTLILIRLPSTHLHRYKCVSKRWFALISDQYFTRRYIEFNKNSTQHDHFIIHNHTLSQFVLPDHPQLLQHHKSIQNIADFSLKFLPIPRNPVINKEHYKIFGASHGLLLFKQRASLYYVCNPLIRQYLELPHLFGRASQVLVGFTCYPVGPTSCEVEFMVLVVEYEILHVFNKFKTHVFRSKTGKWECFDLPSPPQASGRLNFDKNRTVFFYNGSFHWCTCIPAMSVIAYDPINRPNTCRLLRISETLGPNIFSWKVHDIGVIEGRIRLITKQRRSPAGVDENEFFYVYEVIDYDKGIFDWKYQVEEPRKFDVTSRFLSRMNGEMVYFINWSAKKVMLLNMKDGSPQCTVDLTLMSNEREMYERAMGFTMTPWPTPIPKLPEEIQERMNRIKKGLHNLCSRKSS